jgi:hypothetical protein
MYAVGRSDALEHGTSEPMLPLLLLLLLLLSIAAQRPPGVAHVPVGSRPALADNRRDSAVVGTVMARCAARHAHRSRPNGGHCSSAY